MGGRIVGIQRLGCDARGTAHSEVRGDRREHLLVTRYQIERIAAGRQQAFGRFGNRGRGTNEENSAHARCVGAAAPLSTTSPWVTRRQKPEEQAGSTWRANSRQRG